eukprot:TRINITY_DN408_c1_g1_i13.p1 TRINITY_DN408_c1_g1~~TRINITY_DN408_c1_g1_i13.p1  ORF type:complete len:198 (+),score=65.57 TRINITY_DN408_c1_g1_i13:166-759(+)
MVLCSVPASLMILGGNLAEIDVEWPSWMQRGTSNKVVPDHKKDDGDEQLDDDHEMMEEGEGMTSVTIVDPRRSSSNDDVKGMDVDNDKDNDLGPEMPLSWTIVAAVFAVRFVILPCVGLGVTMLIRMLPFVDASDRMFAFVLLVESSAPTAMNTIILCQLHRTSEREIARLMMYEYVASIVILSLWVFVWLAVVSAF